MNTPELARGLSIGFWDKADYGFFMNSQSATQSMMVRPKELEDNATPSANAVALSVLAQVSRRTANLDVYSPAINNSVIAIPSSPSW
jgi:uncharacterized protein YyaL (SSP411 family)